MCRVTSSSSAVVTVKPDLLRVSLANKLIKEDTSVNRNSRCGGSLYDMEKKRTPLPSILRKSSYEVRPATMKSESNQYSTIPGLLSVHDDGSEPFDVLESSTESSQYDTSCCGQKNQAVKRVSFDKKVLVQEFHRLPGEEKTTWHTQEDMRNFQMEVTRLVRQYDRSHWTSFFARCKKPCALHSHPALVSTFEDDRSGDDAPSAQSQQVQKILLVDSHDLSLKLFAKSFQKAFPMAAVTTASGNRDALELCSAAGDSYDLVVVEERLHLFHSQTDSGSALLKVLQKKMPRCLFIGVSAHMERDHALLEEAGADLCWSKPPPPMNKLVLDEICQRIAAKRSGRAA